MGLSSLTLYWVQVIWCTFCNYNQWIGPYDTDYILPTTVPALLLAIDKDQHCDMSSMDTRSGERLNLETELQGDLFNGTKKRSSSGGNTSWLFHCGLSHESPVSRLPFMAL